jgi:hypothetical protein
MLFLLSIFYVLLNWVTRVVLRVMTVYEKCSDPDSMPVMVAQTLMPSAGGRRICFIFADGELKII